MSLGSSGDDLDEDSQVVAVFGLDVDREVNEGSSLSDGLLNLISGQFELVERSDTVVALDILNEQLDLLGEVSDLLLTVLDVSQTNLKNSSLKKIVDFLGTSWLFDTGPSDILGGSAGLGGDDLKPLLLEEWVILGLFLLSGVLADLLVLSFSHFWLVYKKEAFVILSFIKTMKFSETVSNQRRK